MRWHTKPITQLVVMFVVMSMVIGAQTTASALFTGNTQNKTVAKVEETGLRKVAGNIADPTCPNTDAVNYAWTENNAQLAPPRRLRYVDAQWEYDSLNTNYFSRPSQEGEFIQAGYGTKAENLTYRADIQGDDLLNASTIMSSMFRYKPTAFKNAYVLKYSGAPQGPDTPHKGSAPAIEVPSKAGWPVCMPTTGYDIGGGYEAMVVFVDSNRITLHIGIHEYMDGDKPELGPCPLGPNNCRGGYWLYLSGINVDSDIVSAYNSKKGVQQGAGLSSNISDRIQLPIVKPGRRLGTSQGDGVIVLLRDSGPVIYANKNFMWGGGFPEYDPGGTPTNTPPAGGSPTAVPTNPPGGTPTAVPTAPPAGPTPGVPGCFFMTADVQKWQEAGKVKFNVTVKYHSAGGDGDISLEKNDNLVGGPNSWHRAVNDPYVWGPEWTGGAIEVDPSQNIPVKYTGNVWGSAACPGVSIDMVCIFNGDGTCSCGGTSCQAFVPPTPTAGPTNTPVPPGTTLTPTTVPTVPPLAGKGNVRANVVNSTGNLNCSAQLVVFLRSANITQSSIDLSNFTSGVQHSITLSNITPGSYTLNSGYGLYDSTTKAFTKLYAFSNPIPAIVVANSTIDVSTNLMQSGPAYNECSAPATPTPPTGPTTTLPEWHRIVVTVSNACNAPACNEMRSLIIAIESGRLEGTTSSLHWQMKDGSGWRNADATHFSSGTQQSDRFFSFQALSFDLDTLENVSKLLLQANMSDPLGIQHVYLINHSP